MCWERGAHCGHVTRVIVRVSPRWHWQVFSGRRLVTRLLLASSDLSTIKALHQELTKLVTDMQVCVTYCVSGIVFVDGSSVCMKPLLCGLHCE